MKKKIMFIKPALETDAVWEPVRSCSYLGIWYLASLLKEAGHQVYYLDEVFRNNGFNKKNLIERETTPEGHIIDREIEFCSHLFEDKMNDYREMSSDQFVREYSVFNDESVKRLVMRTGLDRSETLSKIREIGPDYIGIPIIATANYLESIRLGEMIKKEFPSIKLIYGGQHCTTESKKMVSSHPWIDHVFIGDGIGFIRDLLEGKKCPKIVQCGFAGMDRFPLLDPEIIMETNYPLEPNYTYTTSGRKYVDFMFSKGCNRKCGFCLAGSIPDNCFTSGNYKRLDNQLRVFRNYGYQEIVVQDDCFPGPVSNFKKVLTLMKKYGFHWQVNGGMEFEKLTNEITNSILSYNSEGEGSCTALYIPFNPRDWNAKVSSSASMSKKFKDNLENVRKLRESGIYVFSSIMLGTPDYNWQLFREDLENSKQLLQDGYFDLIMCFSATLLPGTKWHGQNDQKIINKSDYCGYSIMMPHCHTAKLSVQEIEKMIITWHKELDTYQKTYSWQTAFANS